LKRALIGRLFWLLLPIPLLVMKMNILLIGLVGLILVYALSSRRTRKKLPLYLYIAMMALIFYAIFYAHDPFDLPPIANDIITYAIIVGALIGFYRQIEGSLRSDFNSRIESLRTDLGSRIDALKTETTTRLTEIKADFQREMDKLERRIDSQNSNREKKKSTT
jgi:hypothetical protein